MLLALHRSLQRLIYEYGKVDPREVAISFEMPTREHIDRLTQPTLCLFLHSIQENLDARQSSVESSSGSYGHAVQRWHFRPFYLHYLVTALTTNGEDAYQLLWRTLETLVRYPQIPSELLDEELAQVMPPPNGNVPQDTEVENLSGIWSSLSLPPYPSFSYVVTVPIRMAVIEEAPLVLRSTMRYGNMWAMRDATEVSRSIGGVVQNREGVPLAGVKITLAGSTMEYRTNTEGQFVVSHVPAGPVQLFVAWENAEPQAVSIGGPDNNATTLTSYMIVVDFDATSKS